MGSWLLSASQQGCGIWSGVGFLFCGVPLGRAPVPGRHMPWALQNCLLSLGATVWLCGLKRFPGLCPPPSWLEEEADSPAESTASPKARRGSRVWFWGGDGALCRPLQRRVPPPPPRGDAPCHGCPFLLLWKSLRLRRRIPYIIHATASPGGWVTDGAHLPAPRCLTRGVPWEAGGSSRRAVPGLPARCPSAMPSGGTPAAEGATRGHVSCRNWVQVNTLPGQAVGLGASRRAGTCLVSARGIVSQGPAGAGA